MKKILTISLVAALVAAQISPVHAVGGSGASANTPRSSKALKYTTYAAVVLGTGAIVYAVFFSGYNSDPVDVNCNSGLIDVNGQPICTAEEGSSCGYVNENGDIISGTAALCTEALMGACTEAGKALGELICKPSTTGLLSNLFGK